MTRHVYSNEENACLIDWPDHCKQTGKDCKNTIEQEFAGLAGKGNFASRDKLYTALRVKTRDLLSSFGVNSKQDPEISVEQLRLEGASYINNNGGQIPKNIANAIQVLHGKWDHGELFCRQVCFCAINGYSCTASSIRE